MSTNQKFIQASVRLSDLSDDDDQGQTQRRGPQPGSFAAHVAALQVGETATRAMTLTPSKGHLQRDLDDIASFRERLANNITPAVTRAKRNISGSDYTTEVTQVLTPKGRIYVVAFITRIA